MERGTLWRLRVQFGPDRSLLTDRKVQYLISPPGIPEQSVCQHLAFLGNSGQLLWVWKSSFSQRHGQGRWERPPPHSHTFFCFFCAFLSVIQFQVPISVSSSLICWPNSILQLIRMMMTFPFCHQRYHHHHRKCTHEQLSVNIPCFQ